MKTTHPTQTIVSQPTSSDRIVKGRQGCLPHHPKSGIALVIVLGFLAVLTLLIVTFAVTMRTERLAGSGYVEAAQASHLLNTALSDAMEEIAQMPTNQYFPDFTTVSGNYLPNALFSTYGTIPLANDLDLSIRPSSGTPGSVETLYIPGFQDTFSTIYSDFVQACSLATWERIQDLSGNVIGRTAFVAVNCSGLLDINYVGGYTNSVNPAVRGVGISPQELQLREPLGDVNSSGSSFACLNPPTSGNSFSSSPTAALAYNREHFWKGIESTRSVKKVNDVAKELTSGSAPISAYSKSFVPFSYYLSDQLAPDGSPLIDLSDLSNQAISERLEDIGLQYGSEIYKSFLDYCDADSLPQDTSTFCVERIPMINEIWISSISVSSETVIEGAGENAITNEVLTIEGALNIETWFPAEETYPDGDFGVTITAGVLNTNEFSNKPVDTTHALSLGEENYITAVLDFGLEKLIAVSLALDMDEEDDPSSGEGSFQTETFSFSFTGTNLLEVAEEDDDEEAYEVSSIVFQMDSIRLYTNSLATLQDSLDEVALIRITASNSVADIEFELQEFGGYCIDPRINYQWAGNSYMLWVEYEPGEASTPNEMNPISEEDWGELYTDGTEPTEEQIRNAFYVRNAPMENAAELGFLPTGEPWRTIQLYASSDRDLAPVLDYFYAGEDVLTHTARKGLININSTSPNVLTTAFLNLGAKESPETDEIERVEAISDAKAIANQLIANRDSNPNFSQQSISRIGYAFDFENRLSKIDWTAWSDAKKESLIANSYRLFGWRDNLFTVIVVAQTGSDGNGDGVLDIDSLGPIHRALALVWMDPLTRKAAVVGYIRTDSDKALSGYSGQWKDVLNNFNPDL